MGNTFTARSTGLDVSMSNGSTGVLFDVLALSGSATAVTPWQQCLVVHFGDSERHCSGCSGFDLAEVPWTREHPAEKEYFLQVLDRAIGRHGWDRLHYDPPLIRDQFLDLRLMLAAFTPQETTDSRMGDWSRPPQVHEVDRCVRHHVFHGEFGCRLCDVSCQPDDAPRVWELVSLRSADDGRILHREVVQIPDTELPALLRLLDLDRLDPAPTGIAPPGRLVEPFLRGRVQAVLGRALDPGLDHYLRVAIA